MNESLSEIQHLLQQIAELRKTGASADRRQIVRHLQRIADLATTLALTIESKR